MPLRLHRARTVPAPATDDEQLPPRRLDVDALLIPLQRPAPTAEAPAERASVS